MDTKNEIMDLVESTGKNATAMTQALKEIGGNMQNGIKEVGHFFYDEGFLKGNREGRNLGRLEGSLGTVAVVTLIGTGVLLWKQHKLKQVEKDHQEDGQRIIEAFRANVETEIPIEKESGATIKPEDKGEIIKEDTV